MLKFILALPLALGLQLAAAQPQRAPVGDLLTSVVSMSAAQCDQVKASLTPAQRAAQKGMVDMMCVCMPERARQLKASLPKDEASRLMSGPEFQQQYAPRIISGCAAAQMRDQYKLEACRPSVPAGIDAPAYCSCMEQHVQAMPDDEIARLGADMTDMNERTRAALAKHASVPEAPDSVARFMKVRLQCSMK